MITFEELQKKYGGRFIAIEGEEKVIAEGQSFVELMARLKKLKYDKGTVNVRFIRPRVMEV